MKLCQYICFISRNSMNCVYLLFVVGIIFVRKAESNAYFDAIVQYVQEERSFCSQQLDNFLSSYNVGERWALEMYDATSKLDSGLLSGNKVFLGDFDLCIMIRTNDEYGLLTGKYCLGELKLKPFHSNETASQFSYLPEISTLTWALCLPNSCKASDATRIANKCIVNKGKVESSFYDIRCQTIDSNSGFDEWAIAAMCFLLFIILLVILSTAYNIFLYFRTTEGPIYKIFLSFSCIKNGNKLLTMSSGRMQCLDGIRSLSMIWIILGHRFSITSSSIDAMNNFTKWKKHLYTEYTYGSVLAVDTFFVISGFLIVNSYTKMKTKGISLNIPKYYLHRYLRLTPAKLALFFVSAGLLPHIYSGPENFKLLKSFQQPCRDYWWSTLLHIQNYVNVTVYRYVDVDMQLYILSPILLCLYLKWPKCAIMLVTSLIALCIGYVFYISWIYELSPFNPNTKNEFMNRYYLLTHTRASPWLIGILFGFVDFKVKQKHTSIVISKTINSIFWVVSIAVLIACIFGPHYTLVLGNYYDKWGNAFYISLMKPSWALAISWVVFSTTIQNGGVMNWLFSLPIFQFLFKISYSMYLLHVTMFFGSLFSRRKQIYFSELTMWHLFFGDLGCTIVISTVWVLVFEYPIINLEKLLFAKQNGHTLEDPEKLKS